MIIYYYKTNILKYKHESVIRIISRIASNWKTKTPNLYSLQIEEIILKSNVFFKNTYGPKVLIAKQRFL